jgi:hypothetical protein
MERKQTTTGTQAGCPAARQPQPDQDVTAIKARTPAAVLALIPYLLGFHPSHSLVVIGLGPPSGQVHVSFRYDLPDPPSRAHAREIAEHAAAVLGQSPEITAAVVAGYGPGTLVTPVAEAVRERLPAAGIELQELLRAEGGRYWSYLCTDPGCCPAEGVPFSTAAEQVAAEMTLAGRATLPDRGALARTIAPLGGLARQSMRQATRRAEARADELVAAAVRSGRDRAVARVLTEHGLQAVRDAISTCRAGARVPDHDEAAWLALVLTDIRIRDEAWARMDAQYKEEHQRLWTEVVRLAEEQYVAAPASLLAFTAWQSGDGALANVALERALDADPGYTMALLIRDAVTSGLPPSAAQVPMTPEEVAAAYEEDDAGERGAADYGEEKREGGGPAGPGRLTGSLDASGARKRPSG